MNVLVFLTLLATAFGVALRYGGQPERWMASMFAIATGLSNILYQKPALRFFTVERSVALVDVALLAGITVLLLRADRYWPIAMFGFHGVTVLSHLVKFLNPAVIRHAYAIAIIAPAYGTLVILIAATIRHHRRMLLHGGECDWSACGAS